MEPKPGSRDASRQVHMIHTISERTIVQGPLVPEPVKVESWRPIGSDWRLEGRGLYSNGPISRVFSRTEARTLQVIPTESFGGDAERFRLAAEAAFWALAHDYDRYLALSTARIDFLPHQLEAVYRKMLPMPLVRILLADEPGAGKTIMAGLILKELKLRGLVSRTLIVANLSDQWKAELLGKFQEEFDIIRSKELQKANGPDIWKNGEQFITPLYVAKREDVRRTLQQSRWDLIIVDEAHAMRTRSPDRAPAGYELGKLLSDRADHYILLTATPHRGDSDEFCLFLRLVEPDAYADNSSLTTAVVLGKAPFYLRRVKEEMVGFPDKSTGKYPKLFTHRIPLSVEFKLTADELEFHQVLASYAKYRSPAGADNKQSRAQKWVAHAYLRRFGSSTRAVRKRLERRLEILQGGPYTPARDRFDVDDLDELSGCEAMRAEERLERDLVPSDPHEIKDEVIRLEHLICMAKALESGREASPKLAAVKDVLDQQGVCTGRDTKLLIFTEFQETLEYLVERLGTGGNGQPGWHLRVAKISERTRNRSAAVERFREKSQVMIATDAAGEGINLQFCWLMVNFDIPWDINRLEQRMGRIHRLGQKRDCLIFNFVATDTFEGRVLQRLLNCLASMRRDLGDDKVFNVIGELVPPKYIREAVLHHYATDSVPEEALRQIDHVACPTRLDRICNAAIEKALITRVDVPYILERMAEAKERRLPPEAAEKFFVRAAAIAGVTPRTVGQGVYAVDAVPEELYSVGGESKPPGRLKQRYPRLAFDRELSRDNIEWIVPGHPLFEAVRKRAWQRTQLDLLQGAVFYDITRSERTRLHLFQASIVNWERTLTSRLYVVEVGENGEMRLRGPAVLHDLVPAAPAGIDVVAGHVKTSGVEDFLMDEALGPLLSQVKREWEHQLSEVQDSVKRGLGACIERQSKAIHDLQEQRRMGEVGDFEVGEAIQQLESLTRRRERSLARWRRAARLNVGNITRIGTALVLPHPERSCLSHISPDESVRRVAMQRSIQLEKTAKRKPEDVSGQDRGFHIVSQGPTPGDVRFIAVKGCANMDPVTLSPYEGEMARRLRDDYWLYLVLHCESTPLLLDYRNPARLPWAPITGVPTTGIQHLQLSPGDFPGIRQPGMASLNAGQ